MARWFASWKAMRAGRPDGLDLAAVDRLVAGDRVDPQPYGLGLLLDAARAPATAAELAGEQQMVDQLVAARRAVLAESPVRSPDAKARSTARKAVLRLAVGLGLVFVVGVAAETGSLPEGLQQRAHDMFSQLGVPAPDTGRRPGGGPSGGADPASPAPAAGPTPGSSPPVAPTPDPGDVELRVLCQAWVSAGRDPNGAAMDGQDWRTLVTAAGGRARVPALCAALLGAASAGADASATTTHPGAGPATPSHSAGGKRNGWS